MRRIAIFSLTLAALIAGTAQAEVVRIQIDSRASLPGNTGPVGPYELIRGKFFGELDPKDPKNAIIQDITSAPRNAKGKVEYSATFSMSKPVDMSKANGFLYYDVANRGGMRLEAEPTGRVHLTSGWQGDIPASETLQYGTFPVAKGPGGKSIVGPAIARFVDFAPGAQSLPMRGGNAPGVPRPAPASMDTSTAKLVRHLKVGDAGEPIAATDFAFADCSKTPFPGMPDPGQLCVRGGFDAKYAYDLVYQAKDPIVMGIGLAATRDIISFMHNAPDTPAATNPVAGKIKYVVGTGVSQSGNFLRSMINLGFTIDEKGRKLFDGAIPIIAGRQSALNIRFSAPGGSSFTYDGGNEGTVTWTRYNDTVRDEGTHSLLDRCNTSKTCPKVIETFGSTEFWNIRMSPDLVGVDGKADLPIPPNVRRYYNPSVNHGGGNGGFSTVTLPPPSAVQLPAQRCLLPANPNPTSDTVKALYVAMEGWVAKNAEPPPSQYPLLSKGELLSPAEIAKIAPAIPGKPHAGDVYNPFYDYDFGPQYNRVDVSGIMTKLPPTWRELPLLMPKVNSDGNEEAGVQSVNLQAPLGTYLGWNVMAGGYYKGQNCGYQGGFIPFATTKAQRMAAKDPRPSLEERYGDHAGFVAKVKVAADELVAERYLLPEDAAKLVADAQASKVLVPEPYL